MGIFYFFSHFLSFSPISPERRVGGPAWAGTSFDKLRMLGRACVYGTEVFHEVARGRCQLSEL